MAFLAGVALALARHRQLARGLAKVTREELELVVHESLERLTEVEVEVPGVVPLDLAVRRGLRVLHGLLGRRDGIGVRDAEEDRHLHAFGGTTRAIAHHARNGPSGDLVPEDHALRD